ncbi:hypothetical protein Tco_1488218 [Tanacetum coccineum]
MDIFTKGALWDYWRMGSDEIDVSDDESSDFKEYWSDKEEETAKIFKIKTDIFDYEIPLCLAFNEFNYLLKKELKPVKHTCKPFNYKTGCSEWPTCSWREDGYCNGENFPEAYHIGNSLYYQDLEWYEALEYSELKGEALRNKIIIEGLLSDNESGYGCNRVKPSSSLTGLKLGLKKNSRLELGLIARQALTI